MVSSESFSISFLPIYLFIYLSFHSTLLAYSYLPSESLDVSISAFFLWIIPSISSIPLISSWLSHIIFNPPPAVQQSSVHPISKQWCWLKAHQFPKTFLSSINAWVVCQVSVSVCGRACVCVCEREREREREGSKSKCHVLSSCKSSMLPPDTHPYMHTYILTHKA